MRRDPGGLRRLLAGVVACLLLGAIVGLAVVADAQDDAGRRVDAGSQAGPAVADGDQLLGDVRRFIADKRTARFTRASEWSFDEGDGEPVHPERSEAQGELRLPREAHAVEQYEDGSVEEAIVHVDDRFVREANSKGELAQAQWEDASGRGFVGGNARALAEVAEFGLPVDLDSLLGGLRRATSLGGGRVEGWYEMEEVVAEDPAMPIDEGRATVTVEFSRGGRLDRLTVELVQEYAGETTTQRDVYRFTDWGEPVAFTLPDRSTVVRPSHDQGLTDIEEALAERITLYEPGQLPDGWDVQDWSSDVAGDATAPCGYFAAEFGPEPDDLRLAVASSSIGLCDAAPIRSEQLARAAPITLGGKKGWVLHDVAVEFTDLRARMIVIDIEWTRVVVVTNESQEFLESAVRSLIPVGAEPDDVQPA